MTAEQAKQPKPEENEVAMEELEKNARELILAITKKTLKTLEDNGLLKEPSSLQNLSFSSPEMRAFLEKFKAPKYDPCRKFRKGDKVRVVEWSGRNPVLPFMDCKLGDIGTVIKDEETTSFFVRLHLEGKYEKDMPYCHLELVTPVEELEPYFIKEDKIELWWEVWKRDEEVGGLLVALFSTGEHPNSKAAAEAECARLNAEYRKEANNGLGH